MDSNSDDLDAESRSLVFGGEHRRGAPGVNPGWKEITSVTFRDLGAGLAAKREPVTLEFLPILARFSNVTEAIP